VELGELIETIRRSYVGELAMAIEECTDPIVEPVMRDQAGEVRREGKLRAGVRVDVFDRATGDTYRVDARATIGFAVIRLTWAETLAVSLEPFTWDALTVEADVAPGALEGPLRAWADAWIDAEEEDPMSEEGLTGKIHYAGDPEPLAGGARVVIDLGSAPVAAFEELLDALIEAGAKSATLKSARPDPSAS
jgi:hypothetical protein